MKIVIRIVIVLAALVALAAIIGLLMPSKVHMERSMVMKASPEVIYSQVNDLKTHDLWSPWNRMDPNWKVTWGDKTVGEGASYSWESDNKNLGKGSMTISKSVPGQEIITDLDFKENGKAVGTFKFEKEGDATKVTWGFDGDMGGNPFMHLMGAMMDKMMGPTFEQGLTSLDSLTASIPPPTAEMTLTASADSTVADTTKK